MDSNSSAKTTRKIFVKYGTHPPWTVEYDPDSCTQKDLDDTVNFQIQYQDKVPQKHRPTEKVCCLLMGKHYSDDTLISSLGNSEILYMTHVVRVSTLLKNKQ
jgi:hypothetical protein